MLRNTTLYILLATSLLVSVPAIAAVPSIDSVIDQRATQGSTYQFTPTLSTGGTVNWSKAYGPDDVTINPSNGSISWQIPANLPSESFHLGVTATNKDGEATETWIVTVGDGRRIYFDSTVGTLKNAMSSMISGDTLIIRNGTLDSSLQDNVIPGNSSKSQQPPAGTATAYTTIMAEDPGQVTFDMKGVQGKGIHIFGNYDHPDWGFAGGTTARNYLAFKGLVLKQARGSGVRVDYAHHIKFIDIGVVDSGNTDSTNLNSYTVANFYIHRSDTVLVEGLYSWGHSRYKMQFKNSTNSTVRRSIGRIDEYRGDQPIGGFQSYCSKNIDGQNNILIDSNQRQFWLAFKNVAASFAAAATGCANYPRDIFYQRSISLNTSIRLPDNDAEDSPAIPSAKGQDIIGWDIKLDKLNFGTGAQMPFMHSKGNSDINQGTYGNVDTTGLTPQEHMLTSGFFYSRGDNTKIRNSIMYNFGFDGTTVQNRGALAFGTTGNIYDFTNNAIFGFTGTLSDGSASFDGSNTVNIDPTTNGLRYLPKLEDDSALLTAGENNTRSGARVMTFLGKSGKYYNEADGGTETNIPMWPFPHEKIIREKMRNYSYTGLVRDGSTSTLSGIRGYTVDGQTLTNYIWTYLGNIPPAFNITTIPGNGSIELRWDPIADISKPDINGYKIYDVTNGSRNLMATTGLNTYNHKLTGLTNGSNYTFEVVSYNDSQESTYSYRVTNSPTALSRIAPLTASIQ